MVKYAGHCLCGSVKWHANAKPTRALVCHCADCQRATSAPFTAFLGFHQDQVSWQGQINHYQSSTTAARGFCPKCGTRLYFKSTQWPHEIHIHAATLEDGVEYKPTAQVVLRSRANWLDELDDIPAHFDFHQTPKG